MLATSALLADEIESKWCAFAAVECAIGDASGWPFSGETL